MKALPPRLSGFAGILAQAPAVVRAFGKWPGFMLIMTAMLVAFALGVIAILVATIEASQLVATLRVSATW